MAATDALMEGGQATFEKAGDKVSFEIEPKTVGLTKEQLEKYRNDPFWKPVRTVLFVLFWLAWVAMFAAAIAIVVLSPKCAEKQAAEWWQVKVSYQLLTPTFHDSDNDGVGDFKGVSKKIDLLRKLGFTTIYPTPVLKSSKENFFDPYDVVDHLSVDPRYGTQEDFAEMVEAAHTRDMFVVMDLPVSTVSVNHPWFKDAEHEYFVTVKAGDKAGANFYAHPHSNGTKYLGYPTEQNPVLNWQNGRVHNHILEAVKKFLNLGVDGFHIDHVSQLAVNPDGTTNHKEAMIRLKSLTASIKEFVASHEQLKEKKIVLFSSLRDIEDLHAQATETGDLHYVIDSDFASLNASTCSPDLAVCVHKALDKAYERNQADGYVPYWQFSNADVSRLASRFDVPTANLLTFMQLTLPGALSLYYGQELALKDVAISGQRGIMQWHPKGDNHYGFTAEPFSGKLFFGETEESDGNDNFETQYQLSSSTLKLYQKLAKLRQREEALLVGETVRDQTQNGVVSYSRYSKENGTVSGPVFTAILNFGSESATVDLAELKHIPEGRDTSKTEIVAFTSGVPDLKARQKKDYTLEKVVLPQKQAILLKL